MAGHAYEPWDRYDPYCRRCGGRIHPDTSRANIIRDAILALLLVTIAVISCITSLSR